MRSRVKTRKKQRKGNHMTIDHTFIITAASVLSSMVVIFSAAVAVYKWIRRQEEQDRDIKRTKEEQALLTYGVLACLKGLKEQGCDGPVEEAINKIEKHINQVAHE